MKLFKYLSIPAVLLLASTGVQATLVINASTSSDCEADPLCWPVDTNSALDSGTEEGPFQSLYDTTWDLEDPDDATGGTIAWTGDELVDTEINCSVSCYLVVKDGKVGDPNQYIFDISGWDGIMDIVLVRFWVDPDRGAISHVAIYGVVPLPTAFWLFGTALIGFVGVSRRRSV